ncbi:hypothetical protein J2X31_003044 [Flavobacterium arsenatis]|uniref:DUF4348 domain-containing protein n=1 Tax=Flavobacterium arsenatis TaxID=1484332 RepID=A0ABU1TT09_9FLAO|nr:DUF4348 domain-containing protein [Flavobacterium arsenatis]MDR6969018.1 hypothetical protein [Flavobacterium arsenatis]
MKHILFLVFICLTGCGRGGKIQSTCKEDFDSFFEKFATDSLFQKKHVDFPIMKYYSDEDFPLDMMENMIDEESFEAIYFQHNTRRTNDTYEIIIKKETDSVSCYKRGINNPINIEYIFTCKKNSWFLVKIVDNTD